MPPKLVAGEPFPKAVRSERCSLRRLETASEWEVIGRLKRRWPGLGPATGIDEKELKKQGFSRYLVVQMGADLGIRPLPMHPADACFHIPEMVAGLEWRLRHLIEHPAQVGRIDGVRVIKVLGSLVVVRWPSGQLATFGWDLGMDIDGPMSMCLVPAEQVVLQGLPWRWLWLARLMQGFQIELRAELIRQGRMSESELNQRPQAFESYLRDLTQVMRHRLRALPAYRSMRQRIATQLQLDPVALSLSRRIADAPAQLRHHVTMVSSYNRAVEHKDLLLQVQAETPHLFTFYAGMLEDEEFPRHGEPLQRLRDQLAKDLGGRSQYRLLLKTPPRRFVLMRRFIAHLQHENYQDWLRLLHGLSPAKRIPEWLLRILVSQFGNERQRVHLYAKRFWADMSLWAFAVRHWVHLEHEPDEAALAEIRQVALWIVDGPEIELDRRQRQQGWVGLVERAQAWLEAAQLERDQTPIPHAARIPVRQWQDWSLVPLATDFELWQEGTLMGHCLGRYNGPKSGPGTWFASLQHGGKRVLTCQFETQGKRHQLVTALGRFNAKPTPQERLGLSDVLKHGKRPGVEPMALRGVVEVVGQSGVAANEVTVMDKEVEGDSPMQTEELRHAA